MSTHSAVLHARELKIQNVHILDLFGKQSRKDCCKLNTAKEQAPGASLCRFAALFNNFGVLIRDYVQNLGKRLRDEGLVQY